MKIECEYDEYASRNEESDYDGIAAAIDNKVVPRSEWPTTHLQAGAKITVIRAVCGG